MNGVGLAGQRNSCSDAILYIATHAHNVTQTDMMFNMVLTVRDSQNFSNPDLFDPDR